MPLLPLLSDGETEIERSIAKIMEAGAQFVVFAGMTLKQGRQKEHYLHVLRSEYPHLAGEVDRLYPNDRWGNPIREYQNALFRRFSAAALRHRIPVRIPFSLFEGMLSPTDLVIVLLEHLDCFLRMRSRDTSFAKAARSISLQGTSIHNFRNRLRELAGIGPVTERLINEILDTGRCSYYDELAGSCDDGRP